MIRWHESFHSGDVAYLLLAIAIQLLFAWPALGLYYGAMADRKDWTAIGSQLVPLLAVMSICWCLWAYSLAFAPGPGTVPQSDPNSSADVPDSLDALMATANLKDETARHGRGSVVGADDYLFFNSQLPLAGSERPVFPSRRPFRHIPHLLFAALLMSLFVAAPIPLLLQLMGRLSATGILLFAVLWGTIVYAPLLHWVWGDGWLETLGVVDSSGGLLHVGVGFSALACALLYKSRSISSLPAETEFDDHPGRVAIVSLATLAYWGATSLMNSALTMHSDGRAVVAFMNSHLAACAGALTGPVVTRLISGRVDKTTACTGAIAGLIAVAAGSSFILPQSAMITGGTAAAFCCLAAEPLRVRLRGRETLLPFVLQGLAGGFGCFLTGVFATSSVAGFRWDRRLIEGAVEGNLNQIGLQLLGFGAAAAWGFLGTLLILSIVSVVYGRKIDLNPAPSA